MLETTPTKATPTKAGVAETVTSTIAAVMAARDLDPGGIEPPARLSETLGLRSLDLAQIVPTLEGDLNIDPFQTIPITSIRTVGDLTDAYLVSLGLSDRALPGTQDMEAEMAAAKARRRR
ncbi:MAG: acyl carrier protein [Proteobacteria bacterium]|nr:acyl carrier protein [Pseudomonadota bacterium]MCH8950585.1 acyl carrier protein [Pseudomonadota bacterium]